MANIIENANPKKNPITSLIGGVFIMIGALMYVVLYIVPAFVILKQEIPFEWYTPIVPIVIGVVLVFLDDAYFARIFNRTDKIVGKKTDTE